MKMLRLGILGLVTTLALGFGTLGLQAQDGNACMQGCEESEAECLDACAGDETCEDDCYELGDQCRGSCPAPN